MIKNKKRKKVGLALGSGGFRGSAHIAVIKVLKENNIPIDYIAGSSIGAAIGAHYSLFGDTEKMEKDIFKQQSQKYYHLKDLNLIGGVLSGKTLERDFSKMFNNSDFKDANIPIKIVATDLVGGEPFIFKDGSMSRAVRASVSIPLAFKPLKYKDKVLVDGGISNPVPDNVVREMGADIVISVNLYNKYKLNRKKLSLFKTVMRATEITLFNSSNIMNNSDIIINPDTSKFSDMPRLKTYFSEKISREIMKVAERDTRKVIPKIKKMLA
jgi:NTE family protein